MFGGGEKQTACLTNEGNISFACIEAWAKIFGPLRSWFSLPNWSRLGML